MRLYKYIAFDKPYWAEPALQHQLYFSTVAELRGVNDGDDFKPHWEHHSYFFTRYGHYLADRLDHLFSYSRILCMGKNLNQTCWPRFIPSGKGLCYEFEFIPKANDVTSGHIVYADSKELNVPTYILKELNNSPFKGLLEQKQPLTSEELATIITWIDCKKEIHKIVDKHITYELNLKKLNSFRREREYRFVHIVDSIGPVRPQLKLVNSKATFEDLGLNLKRVYTNDIKKVRSNLNLNGVEVVTPKFLLSK